MSGYIQSFAREWNFCFVYMIAVGQFKSGVTERLCYTPFLNHFNRYHLDDFVFFGCVEVFIIICHLYRIL